MHPSIAWNKVVDSSSATDSSMSTLANMALTWSLYALTPMTGGLSLIPATYTAYKSGKGIKNTVNNLMSDGDIIELIKLDKGLSRQFLAWSKMASLRRSQLHAVNINDAIYYMLLSRDYDFVNPLSLQFQSRHEIKNIVPDFINPKNPAFKSNIKRLERDNEVDLKQLVAACSWILYQHPKSSKDELIEEFIDPIANLVQELDIPFNGTFTDLAESYLQLTSSCKANQSDSEYIIFLISAVYGEVNKVYQRFAKYHTIGGKTVQSTNTRYIIKSYFYVLLLRLKGIYKGLTDSQTSIDEAADDADDVIETFTKMDLHIEQPLNLDEQASEDTNKSDPQPLSMNHAKKLDNDTWHSMGKVVKHIGEGYYFVSLCPSERVFACSTFLIPSDMNIKQDDIVIVEYNPDVTSKGAKIINNITAQARTPLSAF